MAPETCLREDCDAQIVDVVEPSAEDFQEHSLSLASAFFTCEEDHQTSA